MDNHFSVFAPLCGPRSYDTLRMDWATEAFLMLVIELPVNSHGIYLRCSYAEYCGARDWLRSMAFRIYKEAYERR
jgi:hypothetical protein